MPTELIPVGPVFAMTQNTIYALPGYACMLFAEGTPTIQQSNTVAFTANVAVTLDANGQAEVAGGWIRCTSASINITLKRK